MLFFPALVPSWLCFKTFSCSFFYQHLPIYPKHFSCILLMPPTSYSVPSLSLKFLFISLTIVVLRTAHLTFIFLQCQLYLFAIIIYGKTDWGLQSIDFVIYHSANFCHYLKYLIFAYEVENAIKRALKTLKL